MAIVPSDLKDLLEERRNHAQKASDAYSTRQESYSEWGERMRTTDLIGRGDWDMVWPDQVVDRVLPRVPNLQVLASEHRSRLLAEIAPSNMCRPEKTDDKTKAAAELRERILASYWTRNNIMLKVPRWGMDLQYTGLAAIKVMADLTVPPSERFPKYMRLDPRHCYPGPAFAEGPIPEDMVVSYVENAKTIERRFGVSLMSLKERAKQLGLASSQIRVIEFYDDKQALAIAEIGTKERRAFEVLYAYSHGIGRCPIAIGVRPSFDGAYRGDFDQLHAVMNTENRLMTLHIDAAIGKVYPSHAFFEVTDMDKYGPDSMHEYSSPQGRVDTITDAAAPYDNYQILKMVADFGREIAMVPESVTGSPSQSIISAAGINATQSMPNAHVVSLQRDSIAPMLQGANEIALCIDELWCDAAKTIIGTQRGTPFSETYTPSKAIAGNYSNEVKYPDAAGLDKVNANVMNLQNLQAGLISRRTAMENSPFVTDPLREDKQRTRESLEEAVLSGIIAGAVAPVGDPRAVSPQEIAAVLKSLESDDATVHEAVLEHMNRIPMAQPAPTPQLSAGQGNAGATNTAPAFNGPSLQDLGVG